MLINDRIKNTRCRVIIYNYKYDIYLTGPLSSYIQVRIHM